MFDTGYVQHILPGLKHRLRHCMQSIPIHTLSGASRLSDFEMEQWQKTVSASAPPLPHRHNFYELLFFTAGSGQHEIDFVNHAVKAPAVHFVSAQGVHVVKRKPGSQGFSLMFSPAFLPESLLLRNLPFYKPGSTPVLNLQKTQYTHLLPLLTLIAEAYNGSSSLKREVLQALFQALLLKLQEFYLQQQPQVQPQAGKVEFVHNLEQLLEQHYLEHWRVNDYARALHLSVNNLSVLCKKHFSLSAQQLINQRLLLEIKRRLAYSNKAVKEICFDLNFEDPAYFNRFFRKYAGVTPLAYRNALSK